MPALNKSQWMRVSGVRVNTRIPKKERKIHKKKEKKENARLEGAVLLFKITGLKLELLCAQ